MNRGYTLLWRKTWDNPVLHERGKRLSKMEAWLYLTNRAASGIDDDEKDLKRGEFRASYRYLAKAWNWDTAKVFRFIKDLLGELMISEVKREVKHQVKRESQHFIICNYETYNPPRNANYNTPRNTSRNKVKEGFKEVEKKESNTSAGADTIHQLPSVESFQLSERLRKAIQVRDPNARAAKLSDLTHWAREIDGLLKLDRRRIEDCEAVIDWCQKSSFWGPNILSGRKLREKFDTLFGQMQRENGGRSHGNGRLSFEGRPDEVPGSTTERRTSHGDRHYVPKQ